MMKVLSWNCKGTAFKGLVGLIKDLKREFCVSLFTLMKTHTSGDFAHKIIRRIGFDSHHVEEVCGKSEGLRCLRDSSCWNIQVLFSSYQFIRMKVNKPQEQLWYLTVVYGSTRYAPRQPLWEVIRQINCSVIGSWAILGDFDTTLCDVDRCGPPLSSPTHLDHRLLEAIN